jgi:MtN3 and saliva related transmembrane protein
MSRISKATLGLLLISLPLLFGCQYLVPKDSSSLLVPRFHRSEIFGFLAGFGTTFAALPDLVAMVRRRSSLGMNPRMAAITGVFQILWIYYGLLIASRPVIAWNAVAVLINALSVAAFFHFAAEEKSLH